MGDSLIIKGVIFDLDGVLVSTDELHYRAWKELADNEGIPFDRTVNDRLRGVSRMDSLRIILERADRIYSADEQIRMAEQKNNRYRNSLLKLSPNDLLPGASNLLHQLRALGVKTAVASASRNAPLILERLQLLSSLDACADGNDVTRSKPAPDVFLLGAKRLGLAPGHCLVVEDAAAGIEAATRAKMAFFAVGSAAKLPGIQFGADSLAHVTCDEILAAGLAQLSI